MTRYFRKVEDPQRLLARERAPVTGRRVPKVRSKRSDGSQASGAAGSGFPVAAIVGAVAVAVLVAGGVVVAVSRGGGSNDAATPTSAATTIAAPIATVANSATPTTQPSTTVEPSTTVGVTSTIAVVDASIRLTSAAATTTVSATSADPGGQATYSGPLPVFNFTFDCTTAGCGFSLRAFSPGSVNEHGLTTIPATGGRIVSTTTSSATCTSSNGNQLSRNVSNVIDLTLSGSQVVNGISVPQQIGGTLTSITPEAGYVPHVGDVVDQGADIGCAGQTLVFTVAGTLQPSG